jgi:plasmid stability protein
VVVRRTETSLPIETSIDDLPRFVAQASAEREELGVASVELEVPAEVLRLGFWFVDTPGVGSAIAANTATTKRFLPNADAVIFVTSFDTPLGESELQFLDEVRRQVGRLFFVVNKLDLVPEAEAEEVMRFVRDQVFDRTGVQPRTFAISARGALEAKLNADREQLAVSGLPELEQTLVHFLTTEKSKSFLLRMCDRAEQLAAHERFDFELGLSALSDAQPDAAARLKSFDKRIADLTDKQRALVADLLESIRSRFPNALLERTHAWPEELAALLDGALDSEWLSVPGPTARNRVDDTRARLEESGQERIDAWLRRKLPEVRSLLVGIAENHIAKLTGLKGQVERTAAEVFALPLPERGREPTEWSSAELPHLGVRHMTLTIPLHLPWRLSVMPTARLEDEGYRLLKAALAQAAITAADSARSALVEAAARWVEDLGDRIEQVLLDAAGRVRTRLGIPVTDRDMRALGDVEERLATFRAEVAAWDVDVAAAQDEAQQGMPTSTGQAPARALTRCAICERLADVAFEYMAQAQGELATGRERQAEHARSGGFCPTHTWQYAEIASDLGIAQGYAELTEAAADRLRAAEQDASTEDELQAALAQLLPGPERCPACVALAEAERAAVRELLAELPAGPDDVDDAAVPALCVVHTAAVLAANPGLERGSRFVRALADTLGRASEDMRTYSLKRESFRRQLLSDEEQAAYLQAISYLAGNRDLIRPWRRVNDRHVFASQFTDPPPFRNREGG